MSVSEGSALPERPHLDHLKKQARELLELARSGDGVALAKLSAVSRQRATAGVTPATAKLADAQQMIAKQYGFSSWLELKAEVARRRARSLTAQELPDDRERRMDLVYEAIDANDAEALGVLLRLDPSLADGWDDRRPLGHAAENDRAELIDLILDMGASLQPAWSFAHDPLSWAITTSSFRAARRLVERGAPIDLWLAAGLGDVERLPAFFDESGVPIAGASKHGATRYDENGVQLPKPTDPRGVVSDALYIACRNGQLAAARFLLDRGGDPGFDGFALAPSLHWAAFSGNRALVELLLDRGADPEQRDGRYGCTYRQFAVRIPIEWSWLRALERVLAADPSLAHERDESWGPPLHAAAERGLDEHVHALLEAGADPLALDHTGRAAIECARGAENQDAAARVIAMLETG